MTLFDLINQKNFFNYIFILLKLSDKSKPLNYSLTLLFYNLNLEIDSDNSSAISANSLEAVIISSVAAFCS